jgi:hypothetical protein
MDGYINYGISAELSKDIMDNFTNNDSKWYDVTGNFTNTIELSKVWHHKQLLLWYVSVLGGFTNDDNLDPDQQERQQWWLHDEVT